MVVEARLNILSGAGNKGSTCGSTERSGHLALKLESKSEWTKHCGLKGVDIIETELEDAFQIL